MATAKMAISVPSPEKLRLSNCISPSIMNQIPNKIMLRLLGSLFESFIGRLLSMNKIRVFARKRIGELPGQTLKIYAENTST